MARGYTLANTMQLSRNWKTLSEGNRAIRSRLSGDARSSALRQWRDAWNRRKSVGGQGG